MGKKELRRNVHFEPGRSYYQNLDRMQQVISAGYPHMVYAMYFRYTKAEPLVKAATDVMNSFPDDAGIDFFTGVLAELNALIADRIHRDLPAIEQFDTFMRVMGEMGE